MKPALLLQENAEFTGSVEVLDIGLIHVPDRPVRYHQTDPAIISSIYKPKIAFSHKGTFGHGLLVTGGTGKMGAAVLAANGYLRSGAGLLTLLIPEAGVPILQTAVPEAMVVTFASDKLPELATYDVVGAGPGLGTGEAQQKLIEYLIENTSCQLVLDADAINVIANNPYLINKLKPGTILTPHPGEFKRLAGSWENDFYKLELQQKFSVEHQVYVILKGKNSSISCPDGQTWFNPTGNPGMAKGGSGDILTGLITGLAASGYDSLQSCLLGTWLHGLAGDIAAAKLTQEGMNASDIIQHLPEAWKQVKPSNKLR
jgi:NAD(P)H-hydrate epimerase